MNKFWLIYSREHNAFWGPAQRGYVTDIDRAGRYSHLEASDICTRANAHIPHPDHPNEVAVIAPEMGQIIEDAAIVANECIAWRELYHGNTVIKPAEVDTTDQHGSLRRLKPPIVIEAPHADWICSSCGSQGLRGQSCKCWEEK